MYLRSLQIRVDLIFQPDQLARLMEVIDTLSQGGVSHGSYSPTYWETVLLPLQ
jgi:hypothetical protein